MLFTIESKVLESYPATSITAISVGKLTGLRGNSDARVNAEIESAYRAFTMQDYRDEAEREIESWSQVYGHMGLKRGKYRCSFESLYRRVHGGKSLFRIHPLVDICNALSLKHCVCVGAYDAAGLHGDISLRYAIEGETMHAIGREDSLQFSSQSIVYADRSGPFCAYWNYRDSDRTQIVEHTREALIFIDEIECKPGRSKHFVNDLTAILDDIFTDIHLSVAGMIGAAPQSASISISFAS